MTLQELERRLRTLEAIEEIKQLQVHYVNCIITLNWDEVVNCFAEDAVVDLHAGLASGRGEITTLFTEVLSRTYKGLEGDFVVHPLISIEGDKAKGSWLIYFQYAQPRKIEAVPHYRPTEDAPDWLHGFYENEYRRVDGRWKISSLKYRTRLISPLTLAASEYKMGGQGGYGFSPSPLATHKSE